MDPLIGIAVVAVMTTYGAKAMYEDGTAKAKEVYRSRKEQASKRLGQRRARLSQDGPSGPDAETMPPATRSEKAGALIGALWTGAPLIAKESWQGLRRGGRYGREYGQHRFGPDGLPADQAKAATLQALADRARASDISGAETHTPAAGWAPTPAVDPSAVAPATASPPKRKKTDMASTMTGEVTSVETAILAIRQLQDELQAEMEDATAALALANQHRQQAETFVNSLNSLKFGAPITTPAAGISEAMQQLIDAAQNRVRAADLAKAKAHAVLDGLTTHANAESMTASVGGMAERSAYSTTTA